jgi:hypothetical protein
VDFRLFFVLNFYIFPPIFSPKKNLNFLRVLDRVFISLFGLLKRVWGR